jgi:hypothetical protein
LAVKPTVGTQNVCRTASVGGLCTNTMPCMATNPIPAVANPGNTHCYRFVPAFVTNCSGLTCTNLGRLTFE